MGILSSIFGSGNASGDKEFSKVETTTKTTEKDGKVEVLEEMVVDGPRGLKINYYKKSGD